MPNPLRSTELYICPHCVTNFASEAHRNRHWGAKNGACYKKQQKVVADRAAAEPVYDPHDPDRFPCDDEPEGGFDGGFPKDHYPFDGGFPMDEDFPIYDAPPPPLDDPPLPDDEPASDFATGAETRPYQPLPRRVVRHANAPKILGRGLTAFEARRDFEKANGINPYRGFVNADNFEHCEWVLTSNISQRTESNLLKTRMVCTS